MSIYMGDRPFSAADADSFTGRSIEVNEIANSWRTKPLTVLHGPAGIGKTSLLQAGLVPRLKKIHEEPLYPMGPEPPEQLLLRLERRLVSARRPVLVAFDHDCPGPELAASLAPHQGLHILVVTRSHRLVDAHALGAVLGATAHRFELGPLTRSGTAIEALTHPLRNVQRSLAGIADDLLDALATGDPPMVSPYLLQVASMRLWELISEDEAAAGGFDTHAAIADYTGTVMDSLTSEHGLHYCDIGSWLRRDFLVPSGGTRPVPYTDRPPNLDEKVVQGVEDRHLIRTVLLAGALHWELIDPAFEHALRRFGGVDPGTAAPNVAERLADARRLRAEDNIEGARVNAETVLRYTAPGDHLSAEASLLLGEIHAQQGRPDSALFHFKEATSKFTVLGEPIRVGHALAAQGRVHLARVRTDPAAAGQAVQAFRDAMRRAPNAPKIQVDLARAHLASDHLRSAEAVLEEAMTRHDARDATVLRGELRADLGDPEHALRELNLAPPPREPAVRTALALALLRLPDPDRAEALSNLEPDPPADDGPALARASRAWDLLDERDRARSLALLVPAARIPIHPYQATLLS